MPSHRDEESAHLCLGRLVNRFGDDNERVMALIGLMKEADATDDATLEVVLKEYEALLQENPTNIPIVKRRVALLRSIGRIPDAVTALTGLLDFSPTDSEAWSELSDIYFSQGLYSQAIFALEEVLVLQPNAWNNRGAAPHVHQIGIGDQNDSAKQLAEALKRFCRSIELCDDYLRGYYGLKLTTTQLLNDPPKPSKQAESDGLSPPNLSTLQKLDGLATEKLGEITRRFTAGERGWRGFEEAEIVAARELLEKSSSTTVR
ncbi:hypothetical protein PG994_014161 [Apiospora phragmitis]|uniref:ER membrane protein complex subunit 2 n=1 Tax=Apiospora phragmitis TaxID=2905665 RepID=A0ABR1T3J0_9PEZI